MNPWIIYNHFSSRRELEDALEKTGKLEELEKVKKVSKIANLEFIVQEEPKGLGHAIFCAKDYIGDEPFAVLLGDTICVGEPNCTSGLVDIFEKKKSSVFSVEEIKREETRRYGIVSGKEVEKGLMLVNQLIEKPDPDEAPSLLGIQGRYIFTPELFAYQESLESGFGGEMQLTDAMQLLAKNNNLYSWVFEGKRYDIGTMKDWFQSHLDLSLKSEFSDIIEEVVRKL